MDLMDLKECKDFCKKAFRNKKDKNGIDAYLHSYAVLNKVKDVLQKVDNNNNTLPTCMPSDYFKLALLHDVVEDTNLKISVVEEKCNLDCKVTEALDAITRRKEESYFDYIERCSNNRLATFVKICDLAVNIKRGKMSDKLVKERYLPALGYLYLKFNIYL